MAEQNNCLEDKTKNTNSNNNDKTRTAKGVMTSVITQALYSIPGYHILESYRDRICASLPDDYNNTALRLQTLIGASDHMIQWILTGDMSKANHRIYQVVLVYVCFEPHFIKFCDIMEVLATDNEYIMELRKTLIKHLHTDKRITTEEASRLASTKLFTAPDAVKSATGTSNTTNTTDGTFTYALQPLLDHHEELQHMSMANGLPPAAVEAPDHDAHESSNNDAVTSTSMRYMVQSPMNTVDVMENLSDDALQHVSSEYEIDHSSVALLAHNQQSTTTEDYTSDVKDTGTIKSNDSDIMCTSLNDDKIQQLLNSAHDGINDTEMNSVQENILCTANEEIAASLATNSSCTDVSDDLATKLDESSSCKKQLLSLAEQDKHTKIDALGNSEVLEPETKAVVSASGEVRLDMYTDAPKEVHEILEAKDFAIVREKYNEIITCLPDNYEAMMGSLQDHLSDSQICDILSLTAGHSQKILNCLILQLKSKEDLLDFCDHLEKVQEGAGSLKVIIEQLKKEIIEMIQMDGNSATSEKSKTAPVVPPVRPPHKYLPFHPALLVIPKSTNPFDLSLLPDDSKGLAALKKCYSILIENLPSNHLISLLRLQDAAIIPEEVVDSIVPSPSAEIGNKMIINYLIGLIHTEEHIITFCYFAERMIGEFDKCICVLNLRNRILMEQPMKVVDDKTAMSKITLVNGSAAESDFILSAKTLDATNPATISNELEYAGGPTITSIVRELQNSTSYQPELSENGGMKGFLQCMIIHSYGGTYSNDLRAIPMEKPLQNSTSEAGSSITLNEQGGISDIRCYVKKDINKELSFSLYDILGAQKSKCYYLECIEVLFRGCSKSGVWIYYSGYGEEGTGNWCFKDGTISFQDIFTLYKKHLKEKLLYIFSDCCYSGQWIVDCAKCLDEMGVGACGHQAKEQGILIKIFTSCRPNQKATLQSFVAQKAIYFNDKDCSIWTYIGKKLSDTQITHGLDFTRGTCLQTEGPTAPCQFRDIPVRCSWKWEEITALEYENRPSSLIFTVRGTDKGRKAWHLVLVERELLDNFKEKVATGNIDVAKYGYVIKSGWGKDPPDDVLDCIKKCSPSWC